MVTDYRGLEMCQSWVQNDRTTILLFCYSGCQCFFLINLFFLKTLIVCPMEKRTGRLAWVEAIILSNAQATAAFWAMLIKLALATTVIRTKYFPRAECQFACLFSLGTKTSFNRSSAELSLALFSEWQTLWGWGSDKGWWSNFFCSSKLLPATNERNTGRPSCCGDNMAELFLHCHLLPQRMGRRQKHSSCLLPRWYATCSKCEWLEPHFTTSSTSCFQSTGYCSGAVPGHTPVYHFEWRYAYFPVVVQCIDMSKSRPHVDSWP